MHALLFFACAPHLRASPGHPRKRRTHRTPPTLAIRRNGRSAVSATLARVSRTGVALTALLPLWQFAEMAANVELTAFLRVHKIFNLVIPLPGSLPLLVGGVR